MFCVYSSCSPSTFLSLQGPLPLWTTPPTIHPLAAIGGTHPSGILHGSLDSPNDPHPKSGSVMEQHDAEAIHGGDRPILFRSRTSVLPGKRRRPGSAGPEFCSPSKSSSKFPSKADRSVDFSDPHQLDRETAKSVDGSANSAPGRHAGTEVPVEQLDEAGGARIRSRIEARQFPFRLHREENGDLPVHREEKEDLNKDFVGTAIRKTSPREVTSHGWTTTPLPEGDDCRCRNGQLHGTDVRWSGLPSPLQGSPTPSSPNAGTLKFGIDSILRSKERNTDEVFLENHGNQWHRHRLPHHHHQGCLPQRPLPPLLRIRRSRSPGSVGSHLVFPTVIYSPHLFNPPDNRHFFLSSSSSSSSCSSSSSSSSPPSSAAAHLRTSVLPPPPPPLPPPPSLHYTLHSSFPVQNRHSDFSGNAFALLGSSPGLYSPHLHPAQSKKKRSWSRAVFSNLQRKGLEKRFQVQKYVTKPDRRQLAAMLGLTDAQVKVWFQNRRMKWRHQEETMKKKESDPRKLSRRPEAPKDSAPIEDDVIHTPYSDRASAGRRDDSESDDESVTDASPSADIGLDTGGRILAAGDGDAVAASPVMHQGVIMSIADILDARKECVAKTGNSTLEAGSDAEDDVIGVVGSVM